MSLAAIVPLGLAMARADQSYPASVGEFWMVGYLLAVGVRRRARDAVPAPVAVLP